MDDDKTNKNCSRMNPTKRKFDEINQENKFIKLDSFVQNQTEDSIKGQF